MNRRNHYPIGGWLIILLFAVSACAGAKLSSIKMNKDFEGEYLKSVMVIGVAKNEENKKIFEDTFVALFKKHGVKAVSGSSLFPPSAKIKKGLVKEKAANMGLETVLITSLKKIKKETEQIKVPITGAGGRGGIYIPGETYNAPSLEVAETRVIFESRLYEVKTEKMIWAANSEVFDPKSTEETIKALSGTILQNLKDNRLVR